MKYNVSKYIIVEALFSCTFLLTTENKFSSFDNECLVLHWTYFTVILTPGLETQVVSYRLKFTDLLEERILFSMVRLGSILTISNENVQGGMTSFFFGIKKWSTKNFKKVMSVNQVYIVWYSWLWEPWWNRWWRE